MPLKMKLGRKLDFLLAIVILLAGATSVKSQAVPNFSIDIPQGCPPLQPTFTNLSTGAGPGALYSWVYGNGNGITTSVKTFSPSTTYFTGQDYTVTLTITETGKPPVSISKTVKVFKKPVINLVASQTVGCTPLKVDFTSSIDPGDGTITAALWSFGDGTSQSTTSSAVSHTYTSPNSGPPYSVSINATNSFGCVTPFTVSNMITVYPALIPSFDVDSAALCSLAQPAVFHNTSVGDGALSYIWDFGDLTSSTDVNPVHKYSAKGTYPISLTVKSTYGCTASITKPALISAANYSADFSTANSYCPGNTILFVNKSTPAPSTTPLWSFGDGGSGIGFTYGHSYAAAGNYTIKMYENFGVCQDSVIKNITILSAPNISPFIMNKGTSCSAPMVVNFTDTSAGATRWHWNFTSNPADTSNSRTPTFPYTSNGLYSPTLTIINANGCTSTISETINTAQPTATIHKDTILTPNATYCADVTATFKALSADTLATYLWSFGDGTTSTDANPIHTFNKPGKYIINLSFTTIHGCSGGAFPPDTVIVYPKPHASFDAYDSFPCTTNQLETFINLDDSAAKFQWFYGDGKSDINNNDVHTHLYADSGLYFMTLIASSPGCAPDDTTISRYVKTTPIPTLAVANNCDSNRLSAKLTVGPSGGSKYVWDFGDGSPVETDLTYIATKNHLYPKGGRYVASVTVTYGTCIQTTGPVPVYVLGKQKPILTSTKDTLCQSIAFPVKINGVDTNYHSKATGAANYYKVVRWQYNDGTSFNANNGFKMSFSGTLASLLQGKDSIRAIIQSDFFGCYDTTNYIPIHLIGPISKFGDANQLCYHSPVIFTDSSMAVNNVPIVSWKWDFGDKNTITALTGDPVQHLYAFPNTYKPTLTVTDTNGCSNTSVVTLTQIFVYGVKANLTYKPTTITPGFPITFYNTSVKNTGATYLWRFSGDGSTSTSPDSVIHTFPNIGNDTVTLIAYPSMPGACIDTLVVPLKILTIAAPFTDSSYYFHNSGCPPLIVDFTSQPVNTTGLHWDFGDGRTLDNVVSPQGILYDIPGKYVVSLTGYGANGISVISYDTIFVKGPYGKLYSTLDKACAPGTDTLHATSSFIGTFTWDFGDGTVVTTQDTMAVHTYTLPGLFTPSLILVDSTGCPMVYKLDHRILIDTLFAQLGPKVLLCDTGTVLFGPYVVSYAADTLGYPVFYHWDFGTGVPTDTSNLPNPSFPYRLPGDYLTTLEINTPVGCTRTVTDSVHVIGPFPMPVSPDTTICIGGYANLEASNANTYLWSPASTLNKTTGDSVIATPRFTTVYSVIGTDSYKCFMDTANIKVTVDSLPVVTIPEPAPVLSGTDVQIEPIVSADVVSYDWAPPLYLNCTDCATPISTPLAPISYTVTVKTAHGCTSSTRVNVRLLCLQSGVYMANAFSPNFDGHNDYFYPTGSGVKIVKSFQVYSRWGQLLYSNSNFPPNEYKYGWNGSLNGIPQPADTYVYVTEMICFSGENFILKGTVELLR